MNILFVTPYLPSPPQFGAQRRLEGLMRGLAARHRVSLLSYTTVGSDGQAATREYCHELRTVNHDVLKLGLGNKRLAQLRSLASRGSFERMLYLRREFQAELDRMMSTGEYDVVQVEFAQMGIHRLPRRPKRKCCFVLDEHNIEYDIVKRTAEGQGSLVRTLYSAVNWRKLRSEELDAWRRFDGVALTSARDEEFVKREAPKTPTAVVPNAVDLDGFRPGSAPLEPETLVFLGAMDYHPNIEGMAFFLDEVFPLILARRPNTKLLVVGRNPTEALLSRRSANVEFTGLVDDPRPYVARATAMIVPLRLGGGTRFKIVEAMAQGKAIVSTRIGAEGLDVSHEQNILLGDTPQEFASQTERLLADPALGARLGKAARELAERQYGWSAAIDILEAFYKRLLG